MGMPVPGSNIALLRRQMGLSQRQLAKAAGVDVSTLSKLESGKGGYSTESIERIAKTLSVSKGVLFAEPGVVEAAALGMREVPVLTAAELMKWPATKGEDFSERSRFLHASLKTVSQHSFALVVENEANIPILQPGDQLLFDAAKQPEMGRFVVAQAKSGAVYIGRFRRCEPENPNDPSFEVVPEARIYPIAESKKIEGLNLRGVLAEQRHRF